MKKAILLITVIMLLIGLHTIAQSPEKMKYQAVIRDSNGHVVTNQAIGMQISIIQGDLPGTVVYTETQSLVSNVHGLTSTEIGTGTVVFGDFSTIDWANGPYFLQIETDPTGGTSYTVTGTNQLLSVPYAMHAKTADSLNTNVHSLSDADGDTKIQVEENPNEDVIRFDMAGTEFFKMDSGRLEVLNTGRSVFIGEGAGVNDDLSNNRNIAIGDSTLFNNSLGPVNIALGNKALYSNTSGHTNIAIGHGALLFNSNGYLNTAIGHDALANNTTADFNTSVGASALSSNTEGYQNTVIGTWAMRSNTTGSTNTAMGYRALDDNTTGGSNTAIGTGSMATNTIGSYNVAIGDGTLYDNTEGAYNTALGYITLWKNTTGNHNTALGEAALQYNTTADNNTAIGSYSMRWNTTGHSNVASGYESLHLNTYGFSNTAIGYQSMNKNTSGNSNTSSGYQSLYSNTTGISNTAIGWQSTYSNINGNDNTAVGFKTLHSNTSGYRNTAIGFDALNGNTTGYENTAIGYQALFNTTEAGRCAAVGYQAGYNNITGFYTTALGYKAGPTTSNIKNSTALGRGAATTATNQIRIGNSIVTSIGGYEPWTNVSDGRFKTKIREDIVGLDFIMSLQPVSYQLDLEAIDRFTGYTGTPENETDEERQFDLESRAIKEQIRKTGFIAQDVEEAARAVDYDFSGVDKPKNENDFYGLRYAEFVVPLVKGMQEQQQMIEELTNENKQIKDELAQIKLLLQK